MLQGKPLSQFMNYFKIFKIKKGKKDKWLAWCKEIMERYYEAIDTLLEENLTYEQCTIVDDFVFYRYQTIDGKGKLPMNMNKEINKKHKQIMDECLEPAEQIQGYEVGI